MFGRAPRAPETPISHSPEFFLNFLVRGRGTTGVVQLCGVTTGDM